MKYKQLTDNLKAQIDILLQTGNSMRQVGKLLGILVLCQENGQLKLRV